MGSETAQVDGAGGDGWAGYPYPELPLPKCWTRGGLTVMSLQEEFNDPAWVPRGRFRVLKRFIMNWNGWPSFEDRCAMLDGPPPPEMPEEQQARIAAVVHCLCERDGHPLPEWVHGKKARKRGVCRRSCTATIATGSDGPTRSNAA